MNLEDISSFVIENAGQKFNGKDFRQLRQPGVYVFMLNGLALYVGQSNCLLGRVGQMNHKQSDRAMNDCDEVLLYPCVSVDAASKLEKVLISELQPMLNRNNLRLYISKLLGCTASTASRLRAKQRGALETI